MFHLGESVMPQLNNAALLSLCNSLEVKRNISIKFVMRTILALSYHVESILRKNSTRVQRRLREIKRENIVYIYITSKTDSFAVMRQ